ncbi:hypothetical protein FQN49_004882 [Arthroderma sp. PD_2]|nr:hypothetical protein FQN49_004882 [Arthroderma sp. PD_2]
MSSFDEVTLSNDGSSVVIGVGARWGKVLSILEAKGLAVAVGRASSVGVGGLTLGGGISFFAPRYGFVSNTVLSYKIVLASGSIVTASSSTNRDLWRALKGGGNNYGIVTRITVVTFPSSEIWAGFLYMPPSNASKVLSTFHEAINRTGHDINAAGPITCFSYTHQLRIELICVNLVYTKALEGRKKWPECWSPFKSMWTFWNNCKNRTLKNACDAMDDICIANMRQVFGTTTIKNGPATIEFVYDRYKEVIATVKSVNIKGMCWTVVFQPILPIWGHHSGENPFGFDTTEPLVLVIFTVSWSEQRHDQISEKLTRESIEKIDDFATKNGTGNRYRYLNYCGGWQRPFEGYGEDNLRFMQNVSRAYDPEGLIQKGCVGGFKLYMDNERLDN